MHAAEGGDEGLVRGVVDFEPGGTGDGIMGVGVLAGEENDFVFSGWNEDVQDFVCDLWGLLVSGAKWFG